MSEDIDMDKIMLWIAGICVLGGMLLPVFFGPAQQDNSSSYNSVSGAE